MIRLDSVTFGYRAKRPVIRDLSLEIPADARIALIGPSGSGKTTLARLILGLETPDRGSIYRREGLRYSAVFQEDRLLPHRTVLENVTLFADTENAAAASPEAKTGAAGSRSAQHADRFPPEALLARLGLGDVLHRYPDELSGGMKRRAALARALCHPFDLLLLDEPFTGLDDAARRICAEAVRESCHKKALVLISHQNEDAELLRITETIAVGTSYCCT